MIINVVMYENVINVFSRPELENMASKLLCMILIDFLNQKVRYVSVSSLNTLNNFAHTLLHIRITVYYKHLGSCHIIRS